MIEHPFDLVTLKHLKRERALLVLRQDALARNLAPATISLNVRLAKAFLSVVGKTVKGIERQDVRSYLAERSKTVASSTTARELNAIRALFAALGRECLVSHDPTAGLDVDVKPAKARTILPPETVAAYLDAALVEPPSRRSPEVKKALALRNRAVLELLYGTAFRASEVAKAMVTDLDLAGASVLCRRAKRGEPATVPLPPSALPHLDAWLRDGRRHLVRERRDDGGRLLLSERGRPLDGNAVLRIVWLVTSRVGLRAHPHAFRRSVSTGLVRNGASVVAVKGLLGHKRLSTTQRYVATNLDDVRKAVDLLDAEGKVRASS